MALAIISFAFVTLLGMLPVGLKTFRESIDVTVQAQMAQQLLTKAQQTPFDRLAEVEGPYYFDEEGLAAPADKARYKVELSLGDAELPSGAANSMIRQVFLSMERIEGGQETRKMVFSVADMGL